MLWHAKPAPSLKAFRYPPTLVWTGTWQKEEEEALLGHVRKFLTAKREIEHAAGAAGQPSRSDAGRGAGAPAGAAAAGGAGAAAATSAAAAAATGGAAAVATATGGAAAAVAATGGAAAAAAANGGASTSKDDGRWLLDGIDWKIIAELMQTRDEYQCRTHW